jgi:hypothetical protein
LNLPNSVDLFLVHKNQCFSSFNCCICVDFDWMHKMCLPILGFFCVPKYECKMKVLEFLLEKCDGVECGVILPCRTHI